jgi:ATP adenylyltransferase
MDKHLFATTKTDYSRGKRPPVDCILCAVLKGDPRVESLLVWESSRLAVCLNLYPYNPGHLMVFPRKHVERFRDMTETDALAIHRATVRSLHTLEKVYGPPGFNLGWNLGDHSGASIKHLHFHVVPRYAREVGFMDLVGRARVVVEHPQQTLKSLRKAFKKNNARVLGENT